MKKTICIFLTILMILELTACGKEQHETTADEGFKPSRDTSVSCRLKFAGGYDNFEALEAEFDLFNKYYPNVEMVYTKVDDYNGKDVIMSQLKNGTTKKLIGLKMTDRGIARHGYEIFCDERKIGVITSGGISPVRGDNIALGYVTTDSDINIGSKKT